MNCQNHIGNGFRNVSERLKNQRPPQDKQTGMTALGVAIILVLVAFFALLAIRLFPIYMENFSVNSHIKRLAEETDAKSKTDSEIRSTLKKRFRIDDIKNVESGDITIDRQGGSMKISVDYEVRTPAIANVDMVVTFSKEFDVK